MGLGHTQGEARKHYGCFGEGQQTDAEEGLSENIKKLDVCIIQGLGNWRPLFIKRVTPQCTETLLHQQTSCGPRFD